MALVLMVETETRGSRNTDKDQSTDQSPSAANVVLNTLGPPPLLACDCFLGWHLTKSVHTNTLFDLFVSLTRAVFPQSVKNVPPTTSETESFRESSRTICHFFFSSKYFEAFCFQKEKDYKTEMNLIKMDIFVFCGVFKNSRDMTENRARTLSFSSNSNTV